MANLYFGRVITNGDYVDVSTLGENISFTNGESYLIQCQGIATLIEATSKPTEGGFVIYNNGFYTHKHKTGENLYIKADNILINIAEA